MDSFIEELKEKKVICKDDIETLKNYINKKYSKNKSSERASMLSNTVHNILYTQLEGIPDMYKSSIKVTTLKNTFVQNKSSITMYDIFDSCLIQNDLKAISPSLLTDWINLHISNKIEENDLEPYFKDEKQLNINNIENATDITAEDVNNTEVNAIAINTVWTTNIKINILKALKNKHRNIMLCSIIFFIIGLYSLNKLSTYNISAKNSLNFYCSTKNTALENSVEVSNVKFPNSHLPEYMKYKSIDENKLKSFLVSRKSLLQKEPYFSTILSTAKQFNLNPIILFAITGQEQNFVPDDIDNANKIANNPFNVFHSWQEYNTNIDDSSKIAARTVINLSKELPKDEDPFLWIGKKYAEDKAWGKGVKSIFKNLNEKCQLPEK